MERAGGFDHCYALRCAYWEVDMVVPNKKKKTSTSTNGIKVVPCGQQTVRRDLDAQADGRVADEKTPYAKSYFITNSAGRVQVAVCIRASSMWNSVMEEVMT